MNESNELGNFSLFLLHTKSEKAEIGYLSFFFLAGTVINIRALIRHISKLKASKHSSETRLIKLTLHLIIANLLLLSVNCFGKTVWLYTIVWVGGDVLCRMWHAMSAFTLHLWSNLVTSIALDMLICLHSPLNSFKAAPKRTNNLILTSYILAIALASPMTFLKENVEIVHGYYQCHMPAYVSRNPMVMLVFEVYHVATVFYIPFIIMLISYATIACILAKHMKKRSTLMGNPETVGVELSNQTKIKSQSQHYTISSPQCAVDTPQYHTTTSPQCTVVTPPHRTTTSLQCTVVTPPHRTTTSPQCTVVTPPHRTTTSPQCTVVTQTYHTNSLPPSVSKNLISRCKPVEVVLCEGDSLIYKSEMGVGQARQLRSTIRRHGSLLDRIEDITVSNENANSSERTLMESTCDGVDRIPKKISFSNSSEISKRTCTTHKCYCSASSISSCSLPSKQKLMLVNVHNRFSSRILKGMDKKSTTHTRLLRISFLIMFTYMVSWLPYNVLGLARIICHNMPLCINFTLSYNWTEAFIFASACINPFLYRFKTNTRNRPVQMAISWSRTGPRKNSAN